MTQSINKKKSDLRVEDMIRRHLGPVILAALEDSDVEEVQVNPDRSVHIITSSKGPSKSDENPTPTAVESFLRAVAANSNTHINSSQPSLATVLPASLGKCRIQGFVPPLTDGPAFILRKPPSRIIKLEEYVRKGSLSRQGMQVIQELVTNRKNVIVAGPTASGKTTLCNAILSEVGEQFPMERILVLEDTRELHLEHENQLRLLTTAEHTMRHLVRYSLRSTPRRIVVGEVRDAAARDLLDAWITGHPGACATVHGEDAPRALARLAALAQEATPGVDQRRMVAEAVHAVVFIHGHGIQRTVDAIAAVDGFDGDKFHLRSLLG